MSQKTKPYKLICRTHKNTLQLQNHIKPIFLSLFVIHQKGINKQKKIYSITQTLSSPHIKENLLKSSGLVKISASCKSEET